MSMPIKVPLILDVTLDQAGNGNSDNVVTRPFSVIDVHNICTATDSGGNATLTVTRQALGAGGFNALSSAMNCFTLNALTRTTVVTVAERTLSPTDVLRSTIASAGGGTANGRVFIHVLANAITGQ